MQAKFKVNLCCLQSTLTLCKKDKWFAANAKIINRTVKKLDDTFNVVNSLSMVGDDSVVKQKTADKLVDEDFITDASEEDSTAHGLVEDSTTNVLMEDFPTRMRVE